MGVTVLGMGTQPVAKHTGLRARLSDPQLTNDALGWAL